MTKDMLQVGDIVILKSGSPYMTIYKIINDDEVECQRFTKSNKNSHLKQYKFNKELLFSFIPHNLDYMASIHNPEPEDVLKENKCLRKEIQELKNKEIEAVKLSNIPKWIVKLFN